ncbi:MAG: 3-hydroxybutyryl-CoA dehydrogenase [Candidatus Riflebacteria bacterium]|nr:3-hydroxybutyryl-CoA dehydrogenase [Candidatus Riflebacteria bacterium]
MSQNRVFIIGAGYMGQGLAQIIARSGSEVILIDSSEEALKNCLVHISSDLDVEIARWGLTASEKRAMMSRISTSKNIEDVCTASFVIEAIPEILKEKQILFAHLDKLCSPDTILASNTATLAIGEISRRMRYPERVIGLHFLSPAPKTLVVEVVRSINTSDRTLQIALRFVKMLEKTPIFVYENPGSITTRIMLPMINEAVRVLAENIATCDDIDNAMKIGYGMKVGPLAMADFIGLDSIVVWTENIHQETGEMSFVPAKLLRKMVRAGFSGLKSGRGFYRYDKDGHRIEGSGLKPCDVGINGLKKLNGGVE